MQRLKICDSTAKKLFNIVSKDMPKLTLEMAVTVDVGIGIVKATYFLEGDGPDLACVTWLTLFNVRQALLAKDWPNVRAVARVSIASFADTAEGIAQGVLYKMLIEKDSVAIMENCLVFFDTKFGNLTGNSIGLGGEMPDIMRFFHAARLCDPICVVGYNPDDTDIDLLCDAMPSIKKDAAFRASLKTELPLYLSLAAKFKPDGDIKTSTRGVKFWATDAISSAIPTFARVALLVAIAPPASGAVERVFNILRRCFGKDNLRALSDYIGASIMFQVGDLVVLLFCIV
jgi:hypothetical protein